MSSGPQAKQAASRVALPVTQGNKAEDIVVENDLYRVTFSTQGAVVKSWVLKRYRDAKDNLLDTVDVAACETLGFPMSVSVSDAALKTQLNQAIYVAEAAKLVAQGEPAKLSGTQFAPPVNLTFTYSDGKIQAKKQFSFGDELRSQSRGQRLRRSTLPAGRRRLAGRIR